MAATFTMDDLVSTLAASGADYSVRPGMVVSATFPYADQRNCVRNVFHHAQVAAAGQTFTLDRSREWIDEHGYGLVLWPAR